MIENNEAETRLARQSSGPSSTKTKISGVAALILILVTWPGQGVAQKPRHSSEPPSSQPVGKTPDAGRSGVLVSPDEDYHIGVGDVMEVQVEDMPEASKSIRVTAAGTFLMPILGRMRAQGKTPEELAQEIADRLRGDYLKDPKVSVVVKDYNSRSFFIQGAVRNPGVFQIEGRPSLLTLITLAGGLADNHGALSFIIRRARQQQPTGLALSTNGGESMPGPSSPAGQTATPGSEGTTAGSIEDEEPKYELLRVNINNLLKGNFSNNAMLQPGDIVNIPPSDVFYVAGEVKAPGSFSLKEGTTLRQAISLAQGTNYNAATERAIIFRDDASGTRQEIQVDIAAVMKGKKEDVPIIANDIIIVPNSRMKSLGGALIKAFGMTTITRIPVP
jgi:polysaccharide export outer membrane protein